MPRHQQTEIGPPKSEPSRIPMAVAIRGMLTMCLLGLMVAILGLALAPGARGDQPEFVWRPLALPTPAADPTLLSSPTALGVVTVRAYPLYEKGTALRTGDFNGDGWGDVAFTTTSLRLRIWMQDPTCHELREQVDMPIAAVEPRDLAVGDLDGDHDDDVVVAAGWKGYDTSGIIHILHQSPAGWVTTPMTYPVGASPGRVQIGDVSSDGRADIVFASLYGLGVLVQQPSGTFSVTLVTDLNTPNQPDLTIADLNGDDRHDIALLPRNWPSAVVLYLQRADGSGFEPGGYLFFDEENENTSGIAAGDVTGDGLPDILVTTAYNRPKASIVLFARLPGGGFAAPVTIPTHDIPINPVLADWNGDGRQDLIVLNTGYNSFTVHLQQPGGGLGAPLTYAVGDTQVMSLDMRVLDVEDVTGDGAVDVAYLSFLKGLVLANEGVMPDCPEPPLPPVGRAPRFLYAALGLTDEVEHEEIVAGDVTGDGLQDFVAIEHPYATWHNYVRVIPQQADSTFAMGLIAFDDTSLPFPWAFQGLSVGDLNSDGRLDICASNYYSHTFAVGYQQPNGMFQTTWVRVGTRPAAWTAIADWTGDGRNDVGVVADAWYVVPQLPDGTLGAPVQHLADQLDYTILSNMGDWNGDGRMDLYAWWTDDSDPNALASAMRILVQQADGSFTMQTASCMAPTDLQMGDVTGDGRADLVLSYEQNAPWGSLWVLPQQPDGSLGNRLLVSAPRYQRPGGLAIADLNGDGRQDVLVLNSWLYFSVLRQNQAGRLDPPLLYYDVATSNNFYTHRVATIDADQDAIPEAIGVASPDQYLLFLKPLGYVVHLPLVNKE